MTSWTGSDGEDFAWVLRALGYRMDRRPPSPPKPVEVVETVSTEAPPVEGAADTAALPVSGDPAPSASLLPVVSIAANDNTPPPTAISPEPEVAAEAAPQEPAVVEAPQDEAVTEAP